MCYYKLSKFKASFPYFEGSIALFEDKSTYTNYGCSLHKGGYID